jgi:hypothetical protein
MQDLVDGLLSLGGRQGQQRGTIRLLQFFKLLEGNLTGIGILIFSQRSTSSS